MMRNAVVDGWNSPQFEEKVRTIVRSELAAQGGTQRTVTATPSADAISSVEDKDARTLSEYRIAVTVEKYRVSVPFIGTDKSELMASIRADDEMKKAFEAAETRPSITSEYRKDEKQYAEFIFDTTEKADVLAKAINARFAQASGGTIQVEPIKFLPKVKITGIPANATAAELTAEIAKCNKLPVAKFEIVRQYTVTAFNKTHNNAIVKIKDKLAFTELLKEGKLFLFFKWCKVYEELPLESCVRCLRFESHIGCQRTLRCKKCSGVHSTFNCKEVTNKCINCVRHNALNLAPKLSESHMASNPNCGAKLIRVMKIKNEIKNRPEGVNF